MAQSLMGFEYEGRRASVIQVLRVSGLSSSAWYDTRPRKAKSNKQKPGPKAKYSDEIILSALKEHLKNPMFSGEGYKKLKVRLSAQGIEVGKERLLRILSDAELLAHPSHNHNGSSRKHEGRIITDAPNVMYACDIKEWKSLEGKFYMYSIIDHFNDEILSHLCCLSAKASQAAQVLRMALKNRFNRVDKQVCSGLELSLRTDNGSQFIAEDFEKELSFLGIKPSKAFVRSPECNGIIERYHRTIKEQINHKLKKADYLQACQIISQFVDDYNHHWLIHRLGLVSPIQYRMDYQKRNKN